MAKLFARVLRLNKPRQPERYPCEDVLLRPWPQGAVNALHRAAAPAVRQPARVGRPLHRAAG